MIERMKKSHESSYESCNSYRFVKSLRVQQRALNQHLKRLKIPNIMIFRGHDLCFYHGSVEDLVIHLHVHLELDLLDLSKTTPDCIVRRIGTENRA